MPPHQDRQYQFHVPLSHHLHNKWNRNRRGFQRNGAEYCVKDNTFCHSTEHITENTKHSPAVLMMHISFLSSAYDSGSVYSEVISFSFSFVSTPGGIFNGSCVTQIALAFASHPAQLDPWCHDDLRWKKLTGWCSINHSASKFSKNRRRGEWCRCVSQTATAKTKWIQAKEFKSSREHSHAFCRCFYPSARICFFITVCMSNSWLTLLWTTET